MRVAALCLAILVTITAAQAQQNPALTGEPLIGALPEVNPFETEADIQQGAALFQTHCSYCHGIRGEGGRGADLTARSEEHTSELQSHSDLVCRLLLEKK